MPTDEYSNGAIVADAAPDAPETSSSASEGGPDVVSPNACDATFCESFDEGPLGSKWTEQVTLEDADLALVPSTLGPPNALRVRLLARDGTAMRAAYLAKSFPFPKHARCEFDVFAGPGLSTGDIEVFGLRAKSEGKYYSLHVKLGNDELELRESLSDTATPSAEIAAGPWTGAWMHVALDVALGVKATMRARGETKELALRSFPADELTLSVGESGDNDGWGYEVLLDNVACTFTP